MIVLKSKIKKRIKELEEENKKDYDLINLSLNSLKQGYAGKRYQFRSIRIQELKKLL